MLRSLVKNRGQERILENEKLKKCLDAIAIQGVNLLFFYVFYGTSENYTNFKMPIKAAAQKIQVICADRTNYRHSNI